MILKDFSRKIYKRIIYSFETKRILYVGVSPKKRDKDYIKWLSLHNYLTTMDKNILVKDFGAEEHFVLDVTDNLPFPENYFDAIIMLGVIGYGLNDKEEIFKAFDRLKTHLKPEGKIYFDVSKDGRYK